MSKRLIPSDCQDSTPISWEAFAKFISSFESVTDATVCPRYQYGELRLTRLNFYSRIFLGKFTYHHINAQWGPFLSSLLSPFVVAFGLAAVALNAMQVGLNAMQVDLTVQANANDQARWVDFKSVSQWAAVGVLLMIGAVISLVFLVILVMFFHDLWFGLRIVRAKTRNPEDSYWKTHKSAVV